MKNSLIKILIVLFSVSPFLIIEGWLRLVGYKSNDSNYYRGFDSDIELFQEKDGFYETSQNELNRFRFQKFLCVPPKKERRIFCIGDSVTWGDQGPNKAPIAMTYSNYLEQLLNTPENNKNSLEYRVINCGAKTFSSRRVKKVAAHIIKNKEKYRPALISANFGTSEFLEYDAYKTYLKKKNQKKHWITNLKTLLYLQDLLGRLIKKSKGLSLENINSRDEYLKSVFVHPSQFISTLKERDLVLEEARKNIEQIADMCKKASIPLIINTIPGNLKWPPAAYTNNNDSAQIIKETGLLINGNTPQQALKVIENHLNRTATAPKSMPDNKKPAAGIIECAGLHYRSAQAWYALENYYKAREFYLKAKNTDAFPLRALDDYNSIIRSLAGPAGPANPTEPANQAGPALPSGIVVADIDKNISALFKHSIPDFSVYIDNCHPNSRGHKFTAEKIFKQCYQYLIKQDQSDNVFK